MVVGVLLCMCKRRCRGGSGRQAPEPMTSAFETEDDADDDDDMDDDEYDDNGEKFDDAADFDDDIESDVLYSSKQRSYRSAPTIRMRHDDFDD